MVSPLGFLGEWPGDLLWSPLLIACLVASVRMVWTMHGRPKSLLQLMGYSFGPALVCIVAGQMGLLVLLGLTCFLRWHSSRPFLAGVSLWLCMLKPHLFLPFGVALVAWVFATRSYRVLGGAALALGVSAAIASSANPRIWTQYIQMLHADQVDTTPIPCLSMVLRRSVDPEASWLQYLPAALGCAWGLVYFRKRRDQWDWMEHGSRLTLVSIIVAPYAWITDQAILIPALLHGVHLCRSRGMLAPLALASAMIELGIFLGKHPFRSAYYLWTAPAWLAWYLWAVHSGGAEGPTLFAVAPFSPGQGSPVVTETDRESCAAKSGKLFPIKCTNLACQLGLCTSEYIWHLRLLGLIPNGRGQAGRFFARNLLILKIQSAILK
jgi:hypothetical protein